MDWTLVSELLHLLSAFCNSALECFIVGWLGEVRPGAACKAACTLALAVCCETEQLTKPMNVRAVQRHAKRREAELGGLRDTCSTAAKREE